MKYLNPIIPGFYPDPSVCRVGEDYYLVTSSFEYFPGVPIFHSRDLVNWEQIGHCLTRPSQLDLRHAKASGGIYAPTIRHHDGRFYMVTTDTTGIGNFYVWATDPAGPWSEPITVDQGGIDPSLFFDEDGTVYFASNGLFWNEDGLYLSEIDVETGRRLTEPRFLWAGCGGKYPEAPHQYKRNGWYYLLVAEGGTEFAHAITIARSRSPYGPYESCPHNPILCHAGSRSAIQSTGHGDLVQDHNGDWWLVFLGVRHSAYPLVHHLGRETYLAPLTWEEGWPVVGEVQLGMDVDRRIISPKTTCDSIRDVFAGSELALYWNFRRNPVPGAHRLGPNGLSLRALPSSLDDVAPVAFLGRRQQHFDCRFETELNFCPESETDEAGISVHMNERHRCDLFLTSRDSARCVVLRRTLGTLQVETATVSLGGDCPIVLRLVADEHWYKFQIKNGDSFLEVGVAETRHLTTEMAGGFTGVYLGLYATGGGAEDDWAHFRYADYEDFTQYDPTMRQLIPVTHEPTAGSSAPSTEAVRVSKTSRDS